MLLITAAALLAGVQYWVINPALEPLPDGNYGEMSGPVRVLRWPFYGLILAIALLVAWRFFFVSTRRV